jgi:hypothetical protein
MPSRILRESILESDPVNRLGWPAEVFYRRLMSVVDDFGLFDARPSVLRSRLYPIQVDLVTEAEVAGWLLQCVQLGLVRLYSAEGKLYLEFLKLGKPRAAVSKFPRPPGDGYMAQLDGTAQLQLASPPANTQMNTDARSRIQPRADVPYSYSYSGSDSYSIAPTGSPVVAECNSETKEKIPAKSKRSKKEPAEPRPRNELFDAIAEVTGSDPVVSGSHVGKLSALLARAVPPYTPDDVREFGRRFLSLCSYAAQRNPADQRPTLGEIEKYIGKVRTAAKPSLFPDFNHEDA